MTDTASSAAPGVCVGVGGANSPLLLQSPLESAGVAVHDELTMAKEVAPDTAEGELRVSMSATRIATKLLSMIFGAMARRLGAEESAHGDCTRARWLHTGLSTNGYADERCTYVLVAPVAAHSDGAVN